MLKRSSLLVVHPRSGRMSLFCFCFQYLSNIIMGSYSNVYGIDMPSRVELVAHDRDEEAIAKEIGADLVIFQTLPDLISAVRQFNPELSSFDCSVFTGEYVTGGIDEAYLQHLEKLRSDNAKSKGQNGSLGGTEAKSESRNDTSSSGNVGEATEAPLGCSGPMNGADDTVGLYNSWSSSR